MMTKIIRSLLAFVLVCSDWSTASPLEIPRLSSTSCTDRFYNHRRDVVLDVDATESLVRRSDVRDPAACKRLCLQYEECRSATYRGSSRRRTCYLNRANNRDDSIPTRRVSSHLRMAIFERDCSVPNPVPTSCSAQFDPEIPNKALNVKRIHSLREQTNVFDIQSCMTLCLSHDSCRSVTYQQSRRKCYLNTVNNRDDDVDKVVVKTMTLVERQCSEPLCGIQSLRYPPKHDSSRVVGGEEANPHSWPWMVALMDGNKTRCGGSILSKRWIVTSAHCVRDGPTEAPFFSILAGAHHKRHREESKRIHSVAHIHNHDGYGHLGRSHDLALLELDIDLEFSDEILPVCLPNNVEISGRDCVATGWGKTKGTGDRSVLNQVQVPLIPYSVCSRPDYYGARVHPDTMLCAGYEMGMQDTCRGDSGGPLMCYDETDDRLGRFRLYGITSWGKGCGRAKKPGVYTNVRNYLNWIQVTTNNAAQIP